MLTIDRFLFTEKLRWVLNPITARKPTIASMLKGKPSNALLAMLSGLNKQQNNPYFNIDMDVYGGYDKDNHGNIRLTGCAVCCALQEIAGVNFSVHDPDHISNTNTRYKYLKIGRSYKDFATFEEAMGNAINGHLYKLFLYMGIHEVSSADYDGKYHLRYGHWKEQEDKIMAVIEALQYDGL